MSSAFKAFAKFLRLPNLIIVGLTQYLLLYLLFIPKITQAGIAPTLDGFHFFLFVLDTIIITLTGNIINDIEDCDIDLINRSDTVFVSKYISITNAFKLYWSIALFGFLLAIYLAFYVNKVPLLLIYPATVLLLYAYSKYLKKMPLWGNLTVAFFCAGVAGIVLFAEKDAFHLLSPDTQGEVWRSFGAYTLFAFFSTLFREIVKDLEDEEGDKERGCRTLPIAYGSRTAKILAGTQGIALLILVLYMAWIFLITGKSALLWAYPLAGIILPTGISLYLLLIANKKEDYHKISQLIKFIMLGGLLYLIFFYYFG